MTQTLILLGAGVRAACGSARRANFEIHAADLFADSDTRAMARQALCARPYPQALLQAAAEFPPGPWMYTGALENHPELLDAIAERRTLLGNSAAVAQAVRDPVRLFQTLRRTGLPSAESVTDVPAEPSGLGVWLRKPLRGAGGMGIEIADSENAELESSKHYWQRRIEGVPASAIFLANGERARLLGTTYQIIGEQAYGAAGFRYVGNIAPGPLDDAIIEPLEATGDVLAAQFGLQGLFGVDGIVGDERFVPVEVNPRFTASVEVLEMLSPESLVAWHIAVCSEGRLPPRHNWNASPGGLFAGKAIVFARREFRVEHPLLSLLERGDERGRYADIPALGERIEAGHPIATALALAENRAAVEQRLRALASRLYASLDTACSA